MEVSKLLSPPAPEAREHFSPRDPPSTPKASSAQTSRSNANRDDMAPPRPMAGPLFSPPETPANRPVYPVEPSTVEVASPVPVGADASLRDPLLFATTEPDSESGAIVTANEPLFATPAPTDKVDPGLDALVSRHMAMQMLRNSPHQPTRDEYLLALSVVPIVSQRYAENPRRWLQQERRILDERFGGANRVWKRTAASSSGGLAKLAPAPVAALKKQPMITAAAAAAGGDPRNRSRTQRAPRAPRPPKPTPPKKAVDRDTPKRVVAPSREDIDFAALPDYSPPTSTLPANNAKSLKADWRGQMLDLSNDPNRHLLHPAELNLAATLRLSCATYLCSKRRIFMGRLEALRIGKEFRKTDSQQACKIDVNKASKLWTAYDRVGWFQPEHFWKYL